MIKTTIISTIFTTVAFQVSGEPLKEYDLSILPADVAARVIELQEHGDRFEPAIRAIFAAATKPAWAFDDCGHETARIAAVAPQS